MAGLIETSIFTEDIYRIQVSDPVLGGVDGTINIQPEQVANRTRYLKNTLELEHSEDGRHSITNAQVANDAAIAESKLALNYGTQALLNDFTDIKEYLDTLRSWVDAFVGENSFFASGLMQVIQLNWRYCDFGFACEFFVDGLTMRDIAGMNARGVVGRDDSLDVADNKGIVPGTRMLVLDNKGVEEVGIRSVLERGRVRLLWDLSRTYNDNAVLTHTNWEVSTGQAVARKGKVYLSRILPTLARTAFGSLLICRDKGMGTLSVEYRDTTEDGRWHPLDLDAVFPHDSDGTKLYEKYTVVGTNVQFRVTCTSNEPVTIYHMALYSEPYRNLFSSIRTPKLLLPDEQGPEEYWQDMMLLEASPFLCAYRDYFVQTEFGLFDADTGMLVHTLSTRVQDIYYHHDATGMPPEGTYLVKCRQQSDISEWSAWSEPRRITLHTARTLFGFRETPKAVGFDQGELDTLNFYPICFGFDGARLSAGFDQAWFTTKLTDSEQPHRLPSF